MGLSKEKVVQKRLPVSTYASLGANSFAFVKIGIMAFADEP